MALDRVLRRYFSTPTVDAQANIREIVSAAGLASTATRYAKTNGAAQAFTFTPEGSAVATTAPTVYSGRGWAVPLSRWSAPDGRGRVRLAAGDIFGLALRHTIGNSALLASSTWAPQMAAFKYNVTTNAASLIGSSTASSTTSSGDIFPSFVITAEVIFEPDEILMVQVGGSWTVGSGTLGASNTGTLTLNTGSFSGPDFTNSPPFVHYIEPAGEAVAGGVGLARQLVRKAPIEAVVGGVGALDRSWEAFRSHEAVGVALAEKEKLVVFAPYTARAGARAIDGVTTVVKKAALASAVGVGRRVAGVHKQMEVVAGGDSEMVRQWTAVRAFWGQVAGVPDDLRRVVIFVRTFDAVGVPRIRPRINLPWSDLPSGTGGGTTTTTVRRPVYIFED